MTNEQAKAEIMQIYGVLSPSKQQALDMAIKALEQEPKTGHWIFKLFDEETGISNSYWCSECGKPSLQVYKTYCANCGMKMVEPQESEG